MNNRNSKEDLLIGGLDDWAYARWVMNSAALSGVRDYGLLRSLCLGLIAEVIVQGLMVPGDVDADGHHPWQTSPGRALERITREWVDDWSETPPEIGAIVWLANTPAGDAVAREALAREGQTMRDPRQCDETPRRSRKVSVATACQRSHARNLEGTDLDAEVRDASTSSQLWLAHWIEGNSPLFGRHHLIFNGFNWYRVQAFLRSRIESGEAADWNSLSEP